MRGDLPRHGARLLRQVGHARTAAPRLRRRPRWLLRQKHHQGRPQLRFRGARLPHRAGRAEKAGRLSLHPALELCTLCGAVRLPRRQGRHQRPRPRAHRRRLGGVRPLVYGRLPDLSPWRKLRSGRKAPFGRQVCQAAPAPHGRRVRIHRPHLADRVRRRHIDPGIYEHVRRLPFDRRVRRPAAALYHRAEHRIRGAVRHRAHPKVAADRPREQAQLCRQRILHVARFAPARRVLLAADGGRHQRAPEQKRVYRLFAHPAARPPAVQFDHARRIPRDHDQLFAHPHPHRRRVHRAEYVRIPARFAQAGEHHQSAGARRGQPFGADHIGHRDDRDHQVERGGKRIF